MLRTVAHLSRLLLWFTFQLYSLESPYSSVINFLVSWKTDELIENRCGINFFDKNCNLKRKKNNWYHEIDWFFLWKIDEEILFPTGIEISFFSCVFPSWKNTTSTKIALRNKICIIEIFFFFLNKYVSKYSRKYMEKYIDILISYFSVKRNLMQK